jgi:hypothetical protein
VYDAVATEDRNKPSAALVNEGFLNDAVSAASSQGMPGLRVIPTSVPCESSVVIDVEAGINKAMDLIINALVKPLTPGEKSPKKEALKLARIPFKGNLEEVNRFYYRRGWADGLPIIPPTEQAVAEMLTGTDLPPGHIVGELLPRKGKATVEKIAVNAVMAGALPTYMPILIAGVKILADPTSGYGTWGVSTGSWSPFWILNGPVRNDLRINSGTGALSPGDIANATIGRAMQLIIQNIGGARKGIEDMGVLGNPGKYSLVIAENEEASPWEPLHVENGYKKEESTVRIHAPNTYAQIWPLASDDEGILRSIVYNVMPGRSGGFSLILTPPHARTLASHGWAKKDIKEFIALHSRAPAERLGTFWGTSSPIEGAWLHKNRIPMRATDEVPLVKDPETITIIVAGGPGAFIGMLSPSVLFLAGKMMEKITLPANWDKLVAKYKDVVPAHLRY